MSSMPASPWSGLGQREAPPRRDDVDLDEPPVQRIVAAACAPAPFPENPYRPRAGSAAGEPADDDHDDAAEHDEEKPMARNPKTPRTRRVAKRTPRGAGPRFKICAALLAHGKLTRDDLRKHTQLDDERAMANGVFTCKSAGHIEKLDDGRFALTTAGKAWAREHLPAETPARAAPSRRQRKAAILVKAERTRGDVDGTPVAPAVDTPPRTFRCAVFSDGGFFLAKGEARIELDAGEHKQMLHYLERMADEAA